MTTKTFTFPHNPFLPEDQWKFERLERDRLNLLKHLQAQKQLKMRAYNGPQYILKSNNPDIQ